MATGIVLTDVEVIINSVDLSSHVLSATLNYSGDLQDATAMGTAGTRERLSGLKDWSFEINFKQDFDSGQVDATLFSLVGGASVAVSLMANKTAGIGVTNPRYNGNAILESYTPLSGNVGELSSTQCTFQADGVLTRSTA